MCNENAMCWSVKCLRRRTSVIDCGCSMLSLWMDGEKSLNTNTSCASHCTIGRSSARRCLRKSETSHKSVLYILWINLLEFTEKKHNLVLYTHHYYLINKIMHKTNSRWKGCGQPMRMYHKQYCTQEHTAIHNIYPLLQ